MRVTLRANSFRVIVRVWCICIVGKMNYRSCKFNAERWSLILLMMLQVCLIQAVPQRIPSADTGSINVAREVSVDDEKYVFNGIYMPNSKFTMTFPSLLMRPELVASYAEVAARTLSRKVDVKMEAQKSRVDSRTTQKSPPSRVTTKSDVDDSVKFPSNTPKTLDINLRGGFNVTSLTPDPKEMEKCLQDFRFCKDLSYYPINHIEKMINEKKISRDLFIVEEMVKQDVSLKLDGNDDGLGRKQFCHYYENIFFPQAGKNKDGLSRFIVQSTTLNFTQGIRTETCSGKGDPECGGLKAYLPQFYEVQCVQKYAFKKFIVVTDAGFAREPVEIPSCCVCMYRETKK